MCKMKDQDKAKEQLIDELGELRQQIAELKAAEAEREQMEEAQEKLAYDLGERFKELNCLYGISHLVETPDISLEGILQGTVELMPPAWQYPEVTYARIRLEGQEFRTENWRETTWRQTADIFVHGEQRGSVEVGYLEERSGSAEGPFLKEERSLINAIAERLGRITERKRAEEALQRLLEETARGQRLLLALSQASQTVQRARTPEEVYQTIGDEIAELGYHATIFTLTDDRTHLAASYLTFKPALLRTAEKLTGLSAQDYRFPLEAGGFYERIIEQGKVVFSDPGAGPVAEALPGPVRRLAKRLAGVLGVEKAIYAPLKVGGETRSILTVIGADLTEADVPAVMAFASQAEIAIESAELYLATQEELAARKRAEASLRESEERFRQMAENTRDVFWMRDLKSRKLIYVSPVYEQLWGHSIEDAYVKPTSWMRNVHAEDRERVAAAFAKQMQGEPTENEYRIVWPDGSIRWIRDRVSPIYDEAGEAYRMVGVVEDVTEHKQAEEALRESEANYRTLVEQSLQGLLVMQDLRIVFANTAFAEICGYSVEELLSLAPQDVVTMIHSEDQAFVWEHYRDRLMGKLTPARYEYRGIRQDGTVRWLEMSANRIEYQGKPAVQAAIVDITERKQAEEKLQESERKFRTFTESAPAAILIYQDYQCVYANPGAEQITGYTDEELSSMEFWELVHPDYRSRVIEGGKALERGELPVSESQLKIVAKNGEERWIDGRLELIEYEGKRAVLISALDVTDRTQAELERERLLAQIRGQAQRMQHILNAVPEGVLLLDADERIILVNPVAERELVALADAKTGDTLTHLGNRPLAELLTSPPKGLWHEVVADGRVFQAIARPIEDGATPTGWVLVIRDVTQQREIQQRVQQQERLAAVGQLAAGIAHDFNNIMAAIVLYAQMTVRMEGLPAVVRERMETIDEQAKHASNLIQQILDFSRRSVLERRPLDLGPLLKAHVRLLERTLPESIEIKLDPEPDEYATSFTVNADPTRMQQMVTNLALNAREAMRGGGELRIGLERIEVKPGESPLLPEMAAGEWARVTVSDTGTGIPPDALPHIFEPFFTTRAPLGSGLGLAQVHGIVGAHEGRIDVKTQMGQGTTFTIYLPLHTSKPSPVRSHAESPALPTGQGETILVVEDDAVVRKALTDGLELLNYQVLEVSNGQEALEMLEQRGEEIALVLSDVVMPQMGGIALLHALRKQGLTVPVVMLTGHAMQREMEELRAQGMADWLPKPPQLERLAEVVARVLGTD
jgi:two-component system cell cycle sensor histidine kinase/response regulator CckA